MPRHKLEIILHVLAVVSIISGFTSSIYLRSASDIYLKQTLQQDEHWLYEYTSNGFLLFGLHCVIAFPCLILIWPSKESKVEKHFTEVITLCLVFPVLIFFLIYISAEIADEKHYGYLSSGKICSDMKNREVRRRFRNPNRPDSICVCRSNRPDNQEVELPFNTCEGYQQYSTETIVYVVLNVVTLLIMSCMLAISIYLLRHYKKLKRAALIRDRLLNALSQARSSDTSIQKNKHNKKKSKHKRERPFPPILTSHSEITDNKQPTISLHAPAASHSSKVVKWDTDLSSVV